jgi:hypothetical protein
MNHSSDTPFATVVPVARRPQKNWQIAFMRFHLGNAFRRGSGELPSWGN